MAKTYAGNRVPLSVKKLGGGLNTASGPLGLQDNESSDLLNIDFDKFGSILKRNGYTHLNSTATTGTTLSDGLHWFEYTSSGVTVRELINVSGGKLFKMDSLDGTWDDITGALTLTSNNPCSLTNFLNTVIGTNNVNLPFKWDGTTASAMDVPTNLTKAKLVCVYNNYALYANVEVGGVRHGSRIYWSNINSITTWDAADFAEFGKDDGQEITGIAVLGEALVVFKERSIYIVLFTGDRDMPFVISKSASEVGCAAPFSVQNIDNGIMFLAFDGIYYFDGNNSFKVSDRINPTIENLNGTRFNKAIGLYQQNKSKYWLSVSGSGQSTNDTIITWDSINNAFSIYDGINASAMTTVYVGGIEERPYFTDYAGYTYRADYGVDDYPGKVQTAINGYYYTNWKYFDDLVNDKGISHVYIFYQINNGVLTFAYSYDFEAGDQYTQTFSTSTSTDIYGVAIYGTATYAASGGQVRRKDLTGRGRVVRYKFANSNLSETFQVDGFGLMGNIESFS